MASATSSSPSSTSGQWPAGDSRAGGGGRRRLSPVGATEQRWRQREPPFDAQTLYTRLLPTTTLLTAARTLVDVMERQTACRQLEMFDDWHEHDGYNKAGEHAGWGDFRAALQDEGTFRAASPGDDLVRRAWLAEDGSFYLRWLWYPVEPAPVAAKLNDPSEGGKRSPSSMFTRI
jgi:hypothetical protein